MAEPAPYGIAAVDKEAGWTSHDVVARARKVLDTRKIGHSGTLDPDATGLLLLGVGRATRVLRFLTDLPKTYVGEVVLGIETSTLDASGEVVAEHDMTGVDAAAVSAAAASFVGPIQQIPPMVSAVKVDGKRLHQLAREGKEVEREPRNVVIHRLETGEFDPSTCTFRIEVECSSGTYIRTLAADMGAALGGGAHLRDLRRTRIGSFDVEDAAAVDELELMAPARALCDYPAVVVDAEVAAAVRYGKVLPIEELPEGSGPWMVCANSGELLAVYVAHKPGTAKPAVVLAQP